MSAGSSSKEPHAKKIPNELITPYKLTVAILVKCYCQLKDTGEYQSLPAADKVQLRKSFCILALKVLQGPDLGLIDIINLLAAYPALSLVSTKLIDNLKHLYENGVGKLLDTIEELKLTVNGEPNQLEKTSQAPNTVLAKSSCIGYFLRRFIVFFEKLSFSEVSILYATLCKYYEEGIFLAHRGGTRYDRDKWQDKPWSRRQAELFLSTQAALLQNDEGRALNPAELQTRISSMLKSNPDLAEAHFMSFLNYLRVNEICGAMEKLFHCFDRRTNPNVRVFNDDKSKEHRYAALNLAIMHHHFGYMEEAMASLKEAIKIAHEASDHYCLQHALSWLYRLSSVNKDNLIVQCIIKTFELNISYTTSLALQDFAQCASSQATVNPDVVFETLTKGDMVNAQHIFKDLIFTNNTMKSSLWRMYGKTDMCSLWAQVLLYMNIDTVTQNTAYYGEGYLQSVGNIALNFLAEGEYALTITIIQYMKSKYPNEPLSRTWMLVENWAHYTVALYHQKFAEAETVAGKIAVLDKWEGYLKMAEVNLHRGEYNRAYAFVGLIFKNYKQEEHMNDGKFSLLRARILHAEIHSAMFYGAPGHAECLLNICLIEASRAELAYLIALIHLHISHLMMAQGMYTQALRNLVNPKCMAEVMAHGSLYDRSRAKLLYIRAKVKASDDTQHENHRNLLLQAVSDLERIKKDFKKLQAYSRVKNVLHFQVHLYSSLSMETERNNCSLEYQALDSAFPIRKSCRLLKYL